MSYTRARRWSIPAQTSIPRLKGSQDGMSGYGRTGGTLARSDRSLSSLSSGGSSNYGGSHRLSYDHGSSGSLNHYTRPSAASRYGMSTSMTDSGRNRYNSSDRLAASSSSYALGSGSGSSYRLPTSYVPRASSYNTGLHESSRSSSRTGLTSSYTSPTSRYEPTNRYSTTTTTGLSPSYSRYSGNVMPRSTPILETGTTSSYSRPAKVEKNESVESTTTTDDTFKRLYDRYVTNSPAPDTSNTELHNLHEPAQTQASGIDPYKKSSSDNVYKSSVADTDIETQESTLNPVRPSWRTTLPSTEIDEHEVSEPVLNPEPEEAAEEIEPETAVEDTTPDPIEPEIEAESQENAEPEEDEEEVQTTYAWNDHYQNSQIEDTHDNEPIQTILESEEPEQSVKNPSTDKIEELPASITCSWTPNQVIIQDELDTNRNVDDYALEQASTDQMNFEAEEEPEQECTFVEGTIVLGDTQKPVDCENEEDDPDLIEETVAINYEDVDVLADEQTELTDSAIDASVHTSACATSHTQEGEEPDIEGEHQAEHGSHWQSSNYEPPLWAAFDEECDEEEGEEFEEGEEEDNQLEALPIHKRLLGRDEADADSGLGTPPKVLLTQMSRQSENEQPTSISFINVESDSDAESLASEPPVGTSLQRKLNEGTSNEVATGLIPSKSEPHLLRPPKTMADRLFIESMESSRYDSDAESDVEFDLTKATAASPVSQVTAGGRVNEAEAQPAPVFSMSVSYENGSQLWDSSHEESVDDVSDFEDLISTIDDEDLEDEEYDDEEDVEYGQSSGPLIQVHRATIDNDDDHDGTPVDERAMFTPNSSICGSHDDLSWRVTPVREIKQQKADLQLQQVTEAALEHGTTTELQPSEVKSKLQTACATTQPAVICKPVLNQAVASTPSLSTLNLGGGGGAAALLMRLDAITHSPASVRPISTTTTTSTRKLSEAEVRRRLGPTSYASQDHVDVPAERVAALTRVVKPKEAWARKALVQGTTFDRVSVSTPKVHEPLFKEEDVRPNAQRQTTAGSVSRKSSTEHQGDDYLATIERARSAMAGITTKPKEALEASVTSFEQQMSEMRSRLAEDKVNQHSQMSSLARDINEQTNSVKRTQQQSELDNVKQQNSQAQSAAQQTLRARTIQKESPAPATVPTQPANQPLKSGLATREPRKISSPFMGAAEKRLADLNAKNNKPELKEMTKPTAPVSAKKVIEITEKAEPKAQAAAVNEARPWKLSTEKTIKTSAATDSETVQKTVKAPSETSKPVKQPESKQEISPPIPVFNPVQHSKLWRPYPGAKLTPRKTRYIRKEMDIDQLLGDCDKENNQFEAFEQRFIVKDKPPKRQSRRDQKRRDIRRRLWTFADGTRMDADDVLFNKDDFRSLMRTLSPTSRVTMHFEDAQEERAGLQIYRTYEDGTGDYGSYLDNELALSDQVDELEILKNDQRRTGLILRTQPSARVKAITDKLLTSNGRELRRALFTLKQIFQDDNDLVQEFVQSDGLDCLVRVGNTCDSNYQNYILRALGQIMLYLDGMNGVIAHNGTIQWLYSLLASPYRLVAKTALKLLLVFVEYTESNALLLLAAVVAVERAKDTPSWSNVMGILNDTMNSDAELLMIAMTLVNKTINCIPDQDTFYDIVDALEDQSMETAQQRLIGLDDPELSEQCKIYENILANEDQSDDLETNTVKFRHPARTNGTLSRRRSQAVHNNNNTKSFPPATELVPEQGHESPAWRQSHSDTVNNNQTDDTSTNRTQSNRSSAHLSISSAGHASKDTTSTGDASPQLMQKVMSPTREASPVSQNSAVSGLSADDSLQSDESRLRNSRCPPPLLPTFDEGPTTNGQVDSAPVQPQPAPPPPPPVVEQAPDDDDSDDQANVGCMTPFAAALAKRKKNADKKQASQAAVDNRKESEIQWERAREQFKERPLIINDLDFTELGNPEDDQDPIALARQSRMAQKASGPSGLPRGMPPPPPPLGAPPPPPLPGGRAPPPPPDLMQLNGRDPSPAQSKDVKTLKLFWKEAQTDVPQYGSNVRKNTAFWQNIQAPSIDQDKLAQLFETKSLANALPKADWAAKRDQGRKTEILVLGTKRSQQINIGLTKLPPPRNIKQAILKFDSTILSKEGLEKIIQNMLPHPEEIEKIEEAQGDQPDVPLGQAEQFIMLMGSIPDLLPRLKLWLFMMDYALIEKEVAEPLMDLNLAIKELETSVTFKQVMAMLLKIGNSLNGIDSRGFTLDYLAKVPEVKDTVKKESLVHHLATFVMDQYPESTDLYSDLGAVARCAKVDFDEIKQNLDRLEHDCKASWDYLHVISKHESPSLKNKIGDFLTDCAQRIMTVKTIHRRVINKYRFFLLFMGTDEQTAGDCKVNTTCKIISEFALDYRTNREKILQTRKRLAEKRERNKTRGKMWIQQSSMEGVINDTPRARTNQPLTDNERNEALTRALLTESSTSELRRQRQRPSGDRVNQIVADRNAMKMGAQTSANDDDEILDGFVKAATLDSNQPRETRRRAKQFNRKSLRRTRTLKLVEDQIGTQVC